MLIAPLYWPRQGEWERLIGTAPADHNFVIVVNDKGVDSAGTREDAKAKLASYPDAAAVVEKLGLRLCIWR